ncbi:MAG: hypothetical protein FWB75_06485 [Oscillospiraceae bacterium]|nr:hypothetical protein [Oscillospiraceae bacterium]
MDNNGKVYSRKIIAQVIELSERRVSQLTADGILEEYSPGTYKLLPTVQGYIRYLKSNQSGQNTAHDIEKERLAQIKREDAELNLAVKKNELHRAADVEFVMTNMLVAFKAKLEVLPHKLLPDVLSVPSGAAQAEGVKEILKQAIAEALGELSAYDPVMFDEDKYLAELEGSAIDEAAE